MKFVTFNQIEQEIDIFTDKVSLSKHIDLSTTTINTKFRKSDYFYHNHFVVFSNQTVHKSNRGGNKRKNISNSNFLKK
jgi:hypothetical protein